MCVLLLLCLAGTSLLIEDKIDADEGGGVNEIQAIYADVGMWSYELRSDGTATIVGILNPSYFYNSSNYSKGYTVNDIPSKVTYADKEYTVTGLGDGLFKGFKYVALNDGWTVIQKTNNNYMRFFTKITIPNTIETIGSSCFANNAGMNSEGKRIVLEISFEEGSNLKTIGNNAFSKSRVNFQGLSSFASLKEIGSSAFEGTHFYIQSFEMDSPSLNLNLVETIGMKAFCNTGFYSDVSFDDSERCGVSISLPNVKYIGNLAFQRTKDGTTIELNKDCQYGIDKNGTNPFQGCDLGLPNVVTSTGTFQILDGIPNWYVPNESSQDTIVISKEIRILKSIFDRSKVKHISVEEGSVLESIDPSIFTIAQGKNEVLESLDLSNAKMLKEIGNYAFLNCVNLTEVRLDQCSSLKNIGTSSFSNTGIASLSLPASVETIGDNAFSGISLEVIDLTSATSLVSIGKEAFSLNEVPLGYGMKEEFSGVYPTKKIVLDNLVNLREIGDEAFCCVAGEGSTASLKGCSSLVSIGSYAFYSRDIVKDGEDLKTVSKPYAVDLSGCSSLTTLGTLAYTQFKADDSVPMVIDGIANGVAAREQGNGKLIIKSTDFAISSVALKGSPEIELEDGGRFILENGLLMDKNRTVILKTEDRLEIVIPSTVKNVYKDVLSGCKSIKSITILSDIEIGWLSGYTGEIIVDVGVTQIIDELEKAGREFTLRADVDGRIVTLASELGFRFAKPSLSLQDGKVSLSFVYTGGFTDHDIAVEVDGKEYRVGSWSFDITDSLRITVKALPRTSGDNVTITFDLDGGTYDGIQSKSIQISRGLTLLDSDLFVPSKSMHSFTGWFLKGFDNEYDPDAPVTEDITLVAGWTFIGPSVSFDSPYGEISAEIDGRTFDSGDVLPSGTLTLRFYPYPGYDFEAWNVDGKKVEAAELTINAPESDLTISVDVGSYSADSLKSIVLDNPSSIDPSKYSLSWTFGGVVDTSMSNWTGHPSNPVIAGDHVYVRINDRVYQLSLETGIVTGSFVSVTQKDFYHHLAYGNGMLVDYATGKVYDDDLNHLYTLTGGTVSYAYYVDGMFVCMLDGVPAAFDATDKTGTVEEKTCIWKSAEKNWFKMYGTVSTPSFYDGYMYIICVKGKDISLASISLNDGKTADTVELSKLHGAYLDDGWMSLYDGTIYLTSYAYGLFGTVEADIKAAFVTSIKIDGGKFDDETLTYTELNGYDSLTSQFIVFNGRGYVYTCSYPGKKSALIVFDLESMKVLNEYTTSTQTSTLRTHGSIVMDASDFESTKKVRIYLLSYDDAKLYVYQDDFTKTSGSVSWVAAIIKYKKTGFFGGTYCSQTVRFGQNGEMIWYDDSGYLQCYSSKVDRYLFISDGDNAKWHEASGATASGSFSNLDDGVLTIDSKTKAITSVNGKTGIWNLYFLKYDNEKRTYSWAKIDNLADATLDKQHYFAIAQGELPLGTTYTYAVDEKTTKVYEFSASGVPSDVVGKDLLASTNVVRIGFTDPSGIMKDTSYLVVKGQDVTVEYPAVSRSGYSAKWVDSEGNPAPKAPISFSADQIFYLQWIEISYKIDVAGKESSGTMDYTAIVTRTAGTEDLDDLRLFVVVEYKDSKFLNLYFEITDTDGTQKIRFGAGSHIESDEVKGVFLYVVSGDVGGKAFDRYGESSLSYEM